jgi:hypothetical protein
MQINKKKKQIKEEGITISQVTPDKERRIFIKSKQTGMEEGPKWQTITKDNSTQWTTTIKY